MPQVLLFHRRLCSVLDYIAYVCYLLVDTIVSVWCPFIVPATSTQGAIKAEDKAKQAVGGVQLARLSFPPSFDTAAVVEIIRNAVKECYTK